MIEKVFKSWGKVCVWKQFENLARDGLLGTEVYKILNNLNPSFMQELLKLRETNRNAPNKSQI